MSISLKKWKKKINKSTFPLPPPLNFVFQHTKEKSDMGFRGILSLLREQ